MEPKIFDYSAAAKLHLMSLVGNQLRIAYLVLEGYDFDEIADGLELDLDIVYDEFERVCWFLAHENGNLGECEEYGFCEDISNSKDGN